MKNSGPAMAIDWTRFTELVRRYQHFVLSTHIRPDGDAVGSTMAMAAVLDGLDKDVTVVADFELPRTLRFLDPDGRIQRLGTGAATAALDAAEVLMVLDTSAWAQLGGMADVIRATKAVKIVLDHHVVSDDLGAEYFRSTAAEATGRLVCEAACQLGVVLTAPAAASVYAALATDTGWFRFASTTAETYRLAAELVDAGAVPHRLYRDLYENDSLGRLHLIGRALSRATADPDGRLVYTWLEQADFAAAGAVPSDSEDIINMQLQVSGTEAAVILVEQPRGGFKVSFRSRSSLDCSRVAAAFGGGGHKAAAGAFVNLPLDAARAKVLDAVRQAMR
jgi:bifunctional oligoribonuclease and PAP phosphatase NrnA